MTSLEKSKFLRIISAILGGVCAFSMVVSPISAVAQAEEQTQATEDAAQNTEEVEEPIELDEADIELALEEALESMVKGNPYYQYIEKYSDKAEPMEEIVIPANVGEANDEAEVEIGSFEGRDNVLRWSNDTGEVTFKFNVKTEGLYKLEINYFPISGRANEIELGILLDGEAPYDQVAQIQIDRLFKDATEITTDKKDNQSRPQVVAYDAWMSYSIKDKDGVYNEPLSFYLTKGEHTITLTGVKMNLIFDSFRFYNQEELDEYVAPTEEELENTPALPDNKAILIEAENSLYKNSATLYATKDRTDYMASPSHPVKQRYNTVGQDTWNKAGQSITWEVTVPNDGYYSINMRVNQSTMRGLYTNRRLYVDGEVPNEAFNQIKFEYNGKWYEKEIGDENGKPYYIYLTGGEKHTITLEAIPGEIGEVMQRLDNIIYILNNYYIRILMITGPTPDEYTDYNVHVSIPELQSVLQEMIDRLKEEKAEIDRIAGGESSEGSELNALATVLQRAVDKPRQIPKMLDVLKSQISSVSAWMRDFRNQPLEMDFLEVKTVHDSYRNKKYNFFESFSFGFRAFIGSFFEDYSSISDSTTQALNVWVGTSRDQASIVNELVTSSFTPQENINVNVSLVIGSVIEASLAGKGPEIAMFLGGDYPINLAARGLLVDLKSEFSDFDDVATRFNEDVLTHYEFNDGVYGLPSQQTFPMMFYRKDVLEDLGFDSPPETWDELVNMLSKIQSKHLQVGLILPGTVTSQIFDAGHTLIALMLQSGQEIYTEDLKQTTFDTPEANEKFEYWTDFYVNYSFDQQYDAFSRFRTGEMPIVIQPYTFYNQLTVAAPEIRGLWDFTLIPGTEQADGSISHLTNSTSTGIVIFEKVANKRAAWTFLKWFTETQTQVDYGRAQEAVMGPLGRYDTANLEALKELPWSTAEYEKISAQMAQLKEVPIIPASYVVTRNVNNIFRSVVNDHDYLNYSILKYNRDINNEIIRKRQGLGMD
mgnify:FL=1